MLINLHTHLEGRLRPGTAAELAAGVGEDGSRDWEAALQLDRPADLTVYLAKVAASYPFFASATSIERIACEAVEDAAADGVEYLELRLGPMSHVRPGSGPDDVVRAACSGIAEGTRRSGLLAGLVVAALRHHDVEANLAVAAAAARHAGAGVVGFDLAGDELRLPALAPYVEPFRLAAAAGLGLTCHAAEAAPGRVVREAVSLLGVTRIGHGAHLAEDEETMRWAADTGVVVEVCPTSNYFTGAVGSPALHPAPVFRAAGVPMVLGDDNPVQTRSGMSSEREVLRTQLGFDADALDEMDRTSVESAFATDAARHQLRAALGS